ADLASVRAGTRRRPCHHEIFVERVDAHAKALLQIRGFGLNSKGRPGRIDDGEHSAGDDHHDRHRDEHLDDGEARAAAKPSRGASAGHCAFLVLTVMTRASPASLATLPESAVPRSRSGVTSTWMM